MSFVIAVCVWRGGGMFTLLGFGFRETLQPGFSFGFIALLHFLRRFERTMQIVARKGDCFVCTKDCL